VKNILVGLLILVPVAGSERPPLWKDPGPVERLDLAAGPGGAANAPRTPFTFVSEVKTGITPKVIVQDTRGKKWMVKFGDEVKSENFASRIAWAIGYVVRPSWYVREGKIGGATGLHRASSFIGEDGTFRDARFQMFDTDMFRAIRGSKLDLNDRKYDRRELNGLKLTLLLLANWDVKAANTAIFDIGGRQFAAVTDWGASLGDPGSADFRRRKWNCAAFDTATNNLIDGTDNGFVVFNYEQYAARNIDELSQGIRIDDLNWFLGRVTKLSNAQVVSALHASGATEDDIACFAPAFRKRVDAFAAVGRGDSSNKAVRTQRVTKATDTHP